MFTSVLWGLVCGEPSCGLDWKLGPLLFFPLCNPNQSPAAAWKGSSPVSQGTSACVFINVSTPNPSFHFLIQSSASLTGILAESTAEKSANIPGSTLRCWGPIKALKRDSESTAWYYFWLIPLCYSQSLGTWIFSVGKTIGLIIRWKGRIHRLLGQHLFILLFWVCLQQPFPMCRSILWHKKLEIWRCLHTASSLYPLDSKKLTSWM